METSKPTPGNPGNPGTPGSPDSPVHPVNTLSPADAQVLDAIVAAGAGQTGEATAISITDAPRARKLNEILTLLSYCTVAAPPLDMVRQALAKIRRLHSEERVALSYQESVLHPIINVRWAELGAIAAVLLIGLSVLIPVLGRLHDDARTVACADNLGEAGSALAAYATDNEMRLPRRGTWPGVTWWNVGKSAQAVQAGVPIESNAAHLYQLVRTGYVDPNVLNCPGNEHAIRDLSPNLNDYPSAQAASYSYQNQFTPYAPPIDNTPAMAFLADKNPLFVVDQSKRFGLVYNPNANPEAASLFHRQRGQNIFIADGHVIWSATPVLPNGDNIWLANGVDKYNGTEPPSAPDDSFLVP